MGEQKSKPMKIDAFRQRRLLNIALIKKPDVRSKNISCVSYTILNQKKGFSTPQASPKLSTKAPLKHNFLTFNPSDHHRSTHLSPPTTHGPRRLKHNETSPRLLLPSNHIGPAETNRARNHSTDQIQRTQNTRIPCLAATHPMGSMVCSWCWGLPGC